jgi:hypothetical protein
MYLILLLPRVWIFGFQWLVTATAILRMAVPTAHFFTGTKALANFGVRLGALVLDACALCRPRGRELCLDLMTSMATR